MTRAVLEALLHGELLEEDDDIHCPICGQHGENLKARCVAHFDMHYSIDPVSKEPMLREWYNDAPADPSWIIVTCPSCGFVADSSFFVPHAPFPRLEKDNEGYPCVTAGGFELTIIQMDCLWYFTGRKEARTYHELLQIVNASHISELPTSLVSDVEWLRRLAAAVFETLKYKRSQAGVPSNPFK